MIPIKTEEWNEVSKEEYCEIMSRHEGTNVIELFDGEGWRFFIKNEKENCK